MLKCRDVTAVASDYLDRNLTLRQRVGVWWHLLICVHCRRFLRQLRTVVGMLRRREPRYTQPSEALLQRCEAHIQAQLEQQRPE